MSVETETTVERVTMALSPKALVQGQLVAQPHGLMLLPHHHRLKPLG